MPQPLGERASVLTVGPKPARTGWAAARSFGRGGRFFAVETAGFEDEFEYLQGRTFFGMNNLELPWMLGEPMPPNLPDDIIKGMGITPPPAPAPAPAGTPRGAQPSAAKAANATPETLSALAVCGVEGVPG